MGETISGITNGPCCKDMMCVAQALDNGYCKLHQHLADEDFNSKVKALAEANGYELNELKSSLIDEKGIPISLTDEQFKVVMKALIEYNFELQRKDKACKEIQIGICQRTNCSKSVVKNSSFCAEHQAEIKNILKQHENTPPKDKVIIRYNVNDTLRLWNIDRYAVWQVVGVTLGGVAEDDIIALKRIDIKANAANPVCYVSKTMLDSCRCEIL